MLRRSADVDGRGFCGGLGHGDFGSYCEPMVCQHKCYTVRKGRLPLNADARICAGKKKGRRLIESPEASD
jgi:hypothetical protein